QPWQRMAVQNNQQHDEEQRVVNVHKNYFTPNRFYCVETICAPCGVVIAWTKFAKSESPTNILNWLPKVYPSLESCPSFFCIDKACLLMKTAFNNGSWQEWKKTSRFIVDVYHYK